MSFLLVTTTTSNREEAQDIATALVDKRLAACVQIVGPIESRYRWQGRVETAQEWLCLAKTTGDRYEALAATVRRLHSYDVPEIVAVAVVTGDPAYLGWITEETRPGSEGPA